MSRGSLLGLLTVTLPADDIHRAFRLLGLAFTDLRRSLAWFEVGISGGVLHVEVVPAGRRAVRSWLVHGHGLVEIDLLREHLQAAQVRPPYDDWTGVLFGGLVFFTALAPAVLALREAWPRIVRERSRELLTGRLDLRPVVENHWVENRYRSGEVMAPVARYTSKRRRSDLLAYTPRQLGELALFHQGRPRLARGAFGTWRRRRV